MSVPTSTNASSVTEEPLPVQRDSNGSTAIHRSPRALLGVTPSAHLPSTPDKADNWAICCSGGGIRSATYCLGGLQTLDEGSLLGQAKWIIGISGGSYIAASRALVAYGLRQAEEERQAEKTRLAKDKLQAKDTRPAYGRGTPEEDNLRNNTHYIAPDAKTMLMGVLSLLLGAIVTFILAIAPLFVFGHAWGWLLRDQGVLAWSGNGGASASVTAGTWWAAPAAAAAVTLVLFCYWWATLGSGGPDRGAARARWVGWSASITAALALLMVAVPMVIAWLYNSTGALGTITRFFGFSGSGHWSPAALAGVVAAMAAVARSCQAQLAKLKLPADPSGSSPGRMTTLATWARGTLTPWLASLIIIGVGAFATLLWIGNAARAGYSVGGLWPVLVAAGIMVATRALADINRTSLHDFYRWRLADAYAVTRRAVQARRSEHRDQLLAQAARTRLSELSTGDGKPDLVIACTANINASRAVPAGRGGFCLAFDPKQVTLRGNPHGQQPEVRAGTKDYEYLLGHTRFTLGGAMALARADAGVDITLDPTVMAPNGNGQGPAPDLGKGQVLQPWARGTFIRLNGQALNGQQPADTDDREQADPLTGGKLWVCKLGWWEGAPWDVRAYAAGHSAYPCDSTLQQLYDGAEFEAYQELGVWSVKAAAANGGLPLA